ncbi:MAG: phenylalanine--tRNA ligase subunit alpha, partial [Actinomycetota bacterium]
MIADIEAARVAAEASIVAATTVDELRRLDADLLGKQGALASLKAGLGRLATVDEKKEAGAALNRAVTQVESVLA